ncbi:putative membrane protein [Nocardiopsis mwathae]|uniref:Putative membrane protein n=1 Tax=Nocardiopsis mwathae TaxID=1472723 RepID=A0A7W9YIR3_9ACTN|nr:hypothetical protein [Nocardiopsis mwathae]MBB6172888.1 putative membrane protein [Nocardiopsis mwathae]
MELFLLTMLLLHFVGLSALLGVGVAQLRQRDARLLRIMFPAAIVQLLTGVGLVFGNMRLGNGVNDDKIMFKMGIAVLVLLLTGYLAFKAKKSETGADVPADGMPVVFGITLIAVLANTAIAVYWN